MRDGRVTKRLAESETLTTILVLTELLVSSTSWHTLQYEQRCEVRAPLILFTHALQLRSEQLRVGGRARTAPVMALRCLSLRRARRACEEHEMR